MNTRTLYIKNMVCQRCVKVVGDELSRLQLNVDRISLGEVRLSAVPTPEQREVIRKVLYSQGFELIDDKKSRLIARIKTLIIEQIHHGEDLNEEGLTTSAYLSAELGHDYAYLSKLFSAVEGITIEKYVIHQKIEKAKELLAYGELTIKEIAWKLGYSSTQHLSNQFKRVTGLTPTHFKRLKSPLRKPLDKV
ncbi:MULTISPECIES: helix-turn-helix domain-containing protein [unclassified Carboxylicivirga]|uniref:helix-turn-helix domain-containing protein n=1 Tax=Carboxylicivirga TaxID=1628153 RepID=UPI003D353653